jgi:hypothetical protein
MRRNSSVVSESLWSRSAALKTVGRVVDDAQALLGHADVDHPLELFAGDPAVTIVIVHPEEEPDLLVDGCDHHRLGGRGELGRRGEAGAAHIERVEEPLREVAAAEVQAATHRLRIDTRGFAEAAVDGGERTGSGPIRGGRGQGTGGRPARPRTVPLIPLKEDQGR